MKFKIIWLEHHSCYNKTEEKKILKNLPIGSKVTGTCPFNENNVEFECIDTFEADNIKKAKKLVKEDYSEVEIFTVYNAETEGRLFTEEDIYEG